MCVEDFVHDGLEAMGFVGGRGGCELLFLGISVLGFVEYVRNREIGDEERVLLSALMAC